MYHSYLISWFKTLLIPVNWSRYFIMLALHKCNMAEGVASDTYVSNANAEYPTSVLRKDQSFSLGLS